VQWDPGPARGKGNSALLHQNPEGGIKCACMWVGVFGGRRGCKGEAQWVGIHSHTSSKKTLTSIDQPCDDSFFFIRKVHRHKRRHKHTGVSLEVWLNFSAGTYAARISTLL